MDTTETASAVRHFLLKLDPQCLPAAYRKAARECEQCYAQIVRYEHAEREALKRIDDQRRRGRGPLINRNKRPGRGWAWQGQWYRSREGSHVWLEGWLPPAVVKRADAPRDWPPRQPSLLSLDTLLAALAVFHDLALPQTPPFMDNPQADADAPGSPFWHLRRTFKHSMSLEEVLRDEGPGIDAGGVELARAYLDRAKALLRAEKDGKRDLESHQRQSGRAAAAPAKTATQNLLEWAGGKRATLAIVFTDVVGSAALGEQIKDEPMNEVRRAHFAQSRNLIGQFEGRETKTIGDSFMAVFKNADAALDYAMALQWNTGHPQVQIRAGIHIGPMDVQEDDVFGGTVDFAARVLEAITGAEIWLSERAKEDIDGAGSARHKHLEWERHEGVAMKGFPGPFTLWSVTRAS
jgi:class 3 adenylate cyclase